MTLDPNVQTPPDAPATPPNPATVPPAPGGDGFDKMRSSLPEGLRDDVNITRFDSFEEMAREHTNAVGAIGRKGVILPKDDDQADIARFLGELGRPEEATGYSMDGIVLPEGVKLDEEMVTEMTGLLHESGVTQGQHDKLLPGYVKLEAMRAKAKVDLIQSNHVASQDHLKSELGAGFDQKMNLASRAIGHLFGDQGDNMLHAILPDGTKLGDNLGFIGAMMKMAGQIGEDVLLEGDGPKSFHSNRSPDEAKREIKKLEADPEYLAALSNQNSPNHIEMNTRMAELYAEAYPPRA